MKAHPILPPAPVPRWLIAFGIIAFIVASLALPEAVMILLCDDLTLPGV